MKIIKPRKLKKGDVVGIVSPSGCIAESLRGQFDKGVVFLEKMGLRVKIGKNVFKRYYYSAGTIDERVTDIHEMFSDPEVKAIIQSQGGQTANEILDHLDWGLIKNNSKIFGGMSDGTALLLAIFAKTGMVTLHGPDLLWGYGREASVYEAESMKQSLFVGKSFKVLPDNDHKVADESLNSSRRWKSWRKGAAEGRLLGGNISVLQGLQATEFAPSYQDAILFLEGYCNSVDDLARRFTCLRQAGIFKNIKGIVLGYFYGNKLNDLSSNRPVGDVLLEASGNCNFPIIEIGEIGHNTPNCNLPVGAMARIDADNLQFSITEDFFV